MIPPEVRAIVEAQLPRDLASPLDGQFMPDINTGAQPFPPYMTAIFVIRVK